MLVRMTKPHIMAAVAGSQGYADESWARQARPPPPVGTRNDDARIIGTPTIVLTTMVRRGTEGIRAARMATVSAVPPICIIET